MRVGEKKTYLTERHELLLQIRAMETRESRVRVGEVVRFSGHLEGATL